MRNAREQYTREAAQLDRTYVRRFLNHRELWDEPILKDKLKSIDDRRLRLEGLALLSSNQPDHTLVPTEGVSREKQPALSLYADDMNQKLRVLEPLAFQVELFLNSVNSKLRGKSVVSDAEVGLRIAANHVGAVELENLSSGEQHELVLLYHLIFRVQPNSLVLIDEPELSLHPLWQQQFLDDLLQIVEARNFDVVLATHSPYIIGERLDLCISLSDADHNVLPNEASRP